uniref:Sema domain-containing protein n=1 Tax=Xiphophorus couchianus TaxID=32473 RepID=A0A3B5N1X1_9TELE
GNLSEIQEDSWMFSRPSLPPSSLHPSSTSWSCCFFSDSPERPLVHFNLTDVSNTATLLLSNDSSTLYVGASNAILLLNVSQSDVISLRRKVRPGSSRGDCAYKVPSVLFPFCLQVDCQNFVHVVQRVNSTHLYVCGSNAYNPQQAFIVSLHPLLRGNGELQRSSCSS